MFPSLLATLVLLAAGPVNTGDAGTKVHIRPAEAEDASIGTGKVAYLSPEGARSLGQIRLVELPGYRTPLHIHNETDETFYVLEGELTLFVGDKRHTLRAGDYVFIPRGTPHAQGNVTDKPVSLLLTVSPGDFTGFFPAREDIVATTPPGHPDYGPRMRALGNTYDIENIGAPPF